MSAPTIDGTSNVDGAGSSISLALSTSNSNDIIYIVVSSNAFDTDVGEVVSSITDDAGLSWQYRDNQSTGFTPPYFNQNIDIWYAIAPSPLSGDNIYITFTQSIYSVAVVAFGVAGANTSTPFDSNYVGAPDIAFGSATGTGVSQTNSLTTSSGTFLAVTVLGGIADTYTSWTQPTGFNEDVSDTGQQPNNFILEASEQVFSAYNSTTLTWTDNSYNDNQWYIVTDFFVPASSGSISVYGSIGATAESSVQPIYCARANFVPAQTFTSEEEGRAILYPMQPKAFDGNDGYHYIIYGDTSVGDIYYVSTTTGLSWSSPTQLISSEGTVSGTQLSVWYDYNSNTLGIVRTPSTADGNFYYSVGSVSGGTITLSETDEPQATTNYMPSGAVVNPNIFTDGTNLWISVTTSPDGSTGYTEVWLAAIGVYSWSNVLDVSTPNLVTVNGAYTIISGVVDAIILLQGNGAGTDGKITTSYTINDGSSWSSTVETSGTYTITSGGFTTYGSVLYLFSSLTDIWGISVTSGGAVAETNTGLISPIGGASFGVTTDGSRIYLFYGVYNSTGLYYSYSSACGTIFPLSSLTWQTPINLFPAQEEVIEVTASPLAIYTSFGPTAVVVWANSTSGLVASVMNPSIFFAYGEIGATVEGLSEQTFSIQDSGYEQEVVSVTRLPNVPFSGAYALTQQEQDYIVFSYHQEIDMIGQPVTFNIQKIVGEDAYQHPIFAYTPITVNAVVTDMQNEQYEYVEQGLLPVHYAMMWTYAAQPQIGDHVTWQDIQWEVRNSFPKVIGNQTIYYRTLLRRLLTQGTLLSGGTDPTFGDDN